MKQKATSVWQEFQLTFPVAWPMITSQVSYIIVGAIDNIMIARVGVDELATAAFCNNLFAVFIVTQGGLASAISPLISNAIGAKDLSRVGRYFRHSLLLLLMFSCITSIGMLIVGYNKEMFDQSEAVNRLFWSYFPWLIATIPLIALFQAQKQLYDGIKQTKVPMAYNFLAIPLNAVLNYIFIFGKFGAPQMGLAGAGLATFLSRVIVVLMISQRTFFNEKLEQLYKLSFKKFRFEKNIWKIIVRLGVPSSMQYLFEVGAFASAGIMAGQIGKVEIASHQIALNMVSFTFMVAMGWSFATSVSIGHALGEGKVDRCREIGFNNVKIIAIYMLLISLIFFVFRHQLPLIYLDDPIVVGMVASVLLIAGIFQIADGVQAVCIGMLRGIQESLKPTLITLVSYWIVAIPLAHYLAFKTSLGLKGIWYGLAVGLFLSATSLVLLFNYLTKNIDVTGFADNSQ